MTRYLRLLVAAAALYAAPATAQNTPTAEMLRSLMIVDPLVIGTGASGPARPAWTFKHLVEQMSGGFNPSDFIKEWMLQFDTKQVINGFDVAQRPGFRPQFIELWKARDGLAPQTPDADWKPNLANAPLRLSAIVYRPDLMKLELRDKGLATEVFNVRSAGEGRFIFQAVDASGAIKPFTIILEYDLVAETPAAAIAWAKDWKSLSVMNIGDPAYLDKLQAITRNFSDMRVDLDRPNNVPLNQLRTNEFFSGPWELREFRVAGSGKLMMDTVKVNADDSFDNTPELGAFVKARIIGLDPEVGFNVPSTWNGKKFLAGSALTPGSFRWRVLPGSAHADPAVQEAARHRLSLASCNGCHAGETDTTFIHVDLGSTTIRLSKFLLGTATAASCEEAKTKNGVGDLEKRVCAMNALAGATPAQLRLALGRRDTQKKMTIKSLGPAGFDLVDFLRSRRDRVH